MKHKPTLPTLLLAAALLPLACTPEEQTDPDNTTDAQWVDLGLPSGLLWATCNLGASTPEQYGNYYAWGETTTKSDYSWQNYRYANGSSSTLTKYCSDASYGYNGYYTDALTTLEAIDDAATRALGVGTRIPTLAEWKELLANTTATYTTQNGVKGRLLTAPNGNSLFLPAAGYRHGASLGYAGWYGYYWSSSLSVGYPIDAWDFYFNYFDSGDQGMGSDYRYCGRPVRPVRFAH